jgi:hypothetical protein
MTKAQRARGNNGYCRRAGSGCCLLVLIVLAAMCQGCQESHPQIVRPPLAPPRPATLQLQLDNVKVMAPSSVSDTDPDMCPASGSPDPNEKPIGALSSRSAYEFSSQPHLQNLYARLIIQTQICTDSSLSSQDRTRLQAVLNFLKITKAQSFASTVSLTADGQGGIKYPQLVPFSYAYDQSKSTYSVQTIGKGVIPWQVTSAFDVQYSYNANTNLSINTANLFNGIATTIAGAGGAALLSPAANAYLSAGQTVLQSLSQSVFTQINNGNDSFHIDMLQGPDRTLTYRFRDLSNRPLAAVRLVVSFTNSIANPVPIDPTKDDSTHVPHFDQLQSILNVTVGGPSGGQTLLQQISKEQSYQDLLKSTADTTAQSFRSSCEQLESALEATYGLNIYDNALAMGEVLSQDTLYLSSKKFYTSGCFRNRSLLKTMGITVFEQAPSS